MWAFIYKNVNDHAKTKSASTINSYGTYARVYAAVKEMEAKDPKRWLSAPEIAELASVNIETVRRHVRLLTKAKIFEKVELIHFLYRLSPCFIT